MSGRMQQTAGRCCRAFRSSSRPLTRSTHSSRRSLSSATTCIKPRPQSSWTQARALHAASRLSQVPNGPNVAKAADTEAAQSATQAPVSDLSGGFSDSPLPTPEGSASPDATQPVDWTRSYHGLSSNPFPPEAAEILQAPLDPEDVEIKPDGILYLPEIKYRRILNRAFGPGGWGLAPRGETIVTGKAVTREYALVVLGRLVSVARGEQDYFSPDGIPTAAEGCRSNALLRCCKDLGIASELWDPRFIRKFMKEQIREVWVEHQNTKKRKKIFIRKDGVVSYPFKEVK